MGYRSDVTVIFYVSNARDRGDDNYKKAKALLDLWYADLKETPLYRDAFRGGFSEVKDGYVFSRESVKWYRSYHNVDAFHAMVDKFCEDFVDNEQLDGGSGLHHMFCYEFVRIGEDASDIEEDRRGDSDYRLDICRSVVVN